MSKRVRETWETTIVASDDSPYLHLYVPYQGKMYVHKGFVRGDRVRVTVERIPAPRPKGERK